MTYEISETSVNGQKPFTESKSNICFEGIDRFHYACYQNCFRDDEEANG